MQVAKQIEGVVVVKDIIEFYPYTSFPEDGPSPDFVEQEGIFFIDNNLSFDPTTHKLADATPYIDGTVARTKAVVSYTQAELDEIHQSKSGNVIDELKDEAQRRLDEFAGTRGYTNVASLVTYVNSTDIDYQAEGKRGLYLRDKWWRILTTMMNEVLAGTRPIPASFDELAVYLPALTWDGPVQDPPA